MGRFAIQMKVKRTIKIMELSELKDEEKIALYKKVREKYSWCTKPENIARLAKVELTKL